MSDAEYQHTGDAAPRLAALDRYGILDTPVEQRYDDIVLLAAQICQTPVALITLLTTERQWFKARTGIDATDTPISQAICVHALRQTNVLVIPDLAADPRTRENPLVTGEPFIRFYAGAPLQTPENVAIGTLCVIDTAPRPQGITANQMRALEALARQVMALFELHRSMLTLEAEITTRVRERSRTWEVSTDLMGILNTDAIFERSNPSWQRVLGWTREEISRTPFFDFLHPDDVAESRARWNDALRGKPWLNVENRYRCKDGTYRWLSWVAVPEGGKAYCSARDITEQKEQAAALLTERQTAELREQFIAVLGHDLRNPLASIIAGMRLLSKDQPEARRTLVLQHIKQTATRMAGLIDNLLDFARGRLGGGLTLTYTDDGSLLHTIEQVTSEIHTEWPDRPLGQHINLNHPVHCDSTRIGQLLSNLLGNAITHGAPDQPITVRATTNEKTFELSVSNAGPPIPAAALTQLFQPFYRGDTRTSAQGLGLGLYIAAEIARAHGGTLRVDSTAVETCFTFSMPLGV